MCDVHGKAVGGICPVRTIRMCERMAGVEFIRSILLDCVGDGIVRREC